MEERLYGVTTKNVFADKMCAHRSRFIERVLCCVVCGCNSIMKKHPHHHIKPRERNTLRASACFTLEAKHIEHNKKKTKKQAQPLPDR